MSRSGCHWILTIPRDDWNVPVSLPTGLSFLRGQLEQGEGGYFHWQVYAVLCKKSTLGAVKNLFCHSTHCELTRSQAARDYVWKEETRVAPCDVLVRCYHQLRSIRNDSAVAVGVIRSCKVYWGPTGTGKSRRAWDEAGVDAFPKDPRTKWWDGYTGQENIIIDEFRGSIDIAHLLRWLDRYPVRVEAKGQSLPLRGSQFWITSNISPSLWYPELDDETKGALMRRLEVTHCPINMF